MHDKYKQYYHVLVYQIIIYSNVLELYIYEKLFKEIDL